MNYTCSNQQYLRNVLSDLLRQYREGDTVNLTYDIVKQQKTIKQLGFIFGGLIKALLRYFDGLGYRYEIWQIKSWLYSECNVFEQTNLPSGEPIIYSKKLSEMTKGEASNFIENVICFIDNSEIFDGFTLPPELRYSWTHNIDAERVAQIKQKEFESFNSSYLLHQADLTCIKCGIQGGMVYHLERDWKKDYLTIPLCYKCHDYVTTNGESRLSRDIKAILNGLTLEVFCLIAFYMWFKSNMYKPHGTVKPL